MKTTMKTSLTIALALLGVGLRAEGFRPDGSDLILGQGGGRPAMADSARTETAIGFPVLRDLDLPAFRNWRALDPKRQVTVNGSFAMAYRTQRHLLARHSVARGRYLKSMLTTDRRIGEFESGPAKQNLLAVMLSDGALAPRATSYSDLADLADTLRRRLEGHDNRQLTFAIQSTGGERRRHVFLYRAERQTVDGVTWWVSRFYDPHMPVESPARKGSIRFREDSDSWWSVVPMAGAGIRIQVSRDWADAADPGSEPFTTGGTDAGWAELPVEQFLIVDEGSFWSAHEYSVDSRWTNVKEGADRFLAGADYVTGVNRENQHIVPEHDVFDEMSSYN